MRKSTLHQYPRETYERITGLDEKYWMLENRIRSMDYFVSSVRVR